VDLDYQMLDDVPPANPVEQKMKRSAEPTVKAPVKVDPKDTVKELQDDKSDVTGTEKAKIENNVANDSNGTASSTPYYKVKPKYPQAALVSGTEGWIELKIDINEQGEVENVRIIGGEQRNTFQSEARRAVEKWKYKPFRDASGNPVKKIDHIVRVDFKLQDAESSGS
jgi:protein TonB